jgi:hypothetical protein
VLDAANPVVQQRATLTRHVVDKIHACATMLDRKVVRLVVYIVYIMLSAFAIKTQDCAKHASTDPN